MFLATPQDPEQWNFRKSVCSILSLELTTVGIIIVIVIVTIILVVFVIVIIPVIIVGIMNFVVIINIITILIDDTPSCPASSPKPQVAHLTLIT